MGENDMTRSITILGVFLISLVLFKAETAKSENCPVCQALSTITKVESIRDNVNGPSKNMSVWNRSSCGNLAHPGNSVICTNCWYAPNELTAKWELVRQTTNGFVRPLRKEIVDFPLPPKKAISSFVVYTQEITINAVVDKIGFWATLDTRYEDTVRAYAKGNGVGLEVNRHPERKEMYVCGGVRTRIKSPNQVPVDTARPLADPQH